MPENPTQELKNLLDEDHFDVYVARSIFENLNFLSEAAYHPPMNAKVLGNNGWHLLESVLLTRPYTDEELPYFKANGLLETLINYSYTVEEQVFIVKLCNKRKEYVLEDFQKIYTVYEAVFIDLVETFPVSILTHSRLESLLAVMKAFLTLRFLVI